MSLTTEAMYENGVLKPAHALPRKEHDKVRITVHTESSPLLDAYGLLGFTGTSELADRFATDPELDYPPPPEKS